MLMHYPPVPASVKPEKTVHFGGNKGRHFGRKVLFNAWPMPHSIRAKVLKHVLMIAMLMMQGKRKNKMDCLFLEMPGLLIA